MMGFGWMGGDGSLPHLSLPSRAALRLIRSAFFPFFPGGDSIHGSAGNMFVTLNLHLTHRRDWRFASLFSKVLLRQTESWRTSEIGAFSLPSHEPPQVRQPGVFGSSLP